MCDPTAAETRPGTLAHVLMFSSGIRRAALRGAGPSSRLRSPERWDTSISEQSHRDVRIPQTSPAHAMISVAHMDRSSYAAFTTHLQTNTIGPIITAQSLLKAQIPIKCLIFISSDSGSAQRFRPEEDGFAVYAASKAALNQTLRHMAAELTRRGSATKVMALHPGEVETDMAANAELSWEVEGVMSVEQSVGKCIRTIEQKAEGESGTFWTWEGEVRSTIRNERFLQN